MLLNDFHVELIDAQAAGVNGKSRSISPYPSNFLALIPALCPQSMRKEAMILKNQVAHVRAERNAMAEALTQWLVTLYFSFQDDENLYLVMELCPGGDLMSLLIKEDVLPEAAVRFYAAEAVLAVKAVHDAGYIHRDLKVRADARTRMC